MKKTQLLKSAIALILMSALCICCLSCDTEENTPPEDTETGDTTMTTTEKADPEPETDDGWVSAIFGGGPFVTGSTAVIKKMQQSGFNTMIIWSVHVHADGTLYLNDILVAKDGVCTIKGRQLEAWKSIKEGDSSIKRIELSIGAWGCADFEGIRDLIKKDGTGEDTILYKNFKALAEACGADAINYDDESCYDVDSAVKFGEMCVSMGLKVALCPYTNMSFWKSVLTRLGDNVDRVYLQCYSGGAGNDVATWQKALNFDIIPGYWGGTGGGRDTAAAVKNKLRNCKLYITGGFMWLYDELQNLGSPNSVKDYATAINSSKPGK